MSTIEDPPYSLYVDYILHIVSMSTIEDPPYSLYVEDLRRRREVSDVESRGEAQILTSPLYIVTLYSK